MLRTEVDDQKHDQTHAALTVEDHGIGGFVNGHGIRATFPAHGGPLGAGRVEKDHPKTVYGPPCRPS